MALKNAHASVQILDADGSVKAFDQPFRYDDATATLANIASWVSGLGASVDTVTDGQVTKIRISLLIPLPSGIKGAPNSQSVNERTGLITFNVNGSPNAFGVDVPAYLPTLFSADTIPDSGATAAFETYLTTAVSTVQATDRYGNPLLSRKSAKKTFREDR